MSWAQRRLDQLGSVSRGRSRHRPRDAAHLYGGAHPFIQTGDVKHAGLYVTEFTQTYSDAGLEQSKLWPAGTLCITIAANIADTAILGIDACFPDSVIGFTPDPKKSDARFVKYLFDATIKRLAQQFSQGATQDNLSQEKLLSLEFEVPSVDEQGRVADILSAYDDLIENNRRRMTLLEESARLLYRDWFVRLRFPGYEHTRLVDEVPSGWERLPFSELAEFINGYPFAPDELGTEGLPIVKIPELRDGVSEKTPRNDGDKIPERYVLRDGDLLFSWSGTLLIEFWYDGAALLNQHLFRVEPNGRCSRAFLLFALRQALPEFGNQSVGATMKHIRKSALSTVTVRLPSHSLLTQFDEISMSVFKQIQNLRHQNQKLRAARDLLLPRLMSGELVV